MFGVLLFSISVVGCSPTLDEGIDENKINNQVQEEDANVDEDNKTPEEDTNVDEDNKTPKEDTNVDEDNKTPEEDTNIDEDIKTPEENKEINASRAQSYFTVEEAVNGEFYIIDSNINLDVIWQNYIPPKYDESFFEENSLFAIKFIEQNENSLSKIKSYNIENEILTINIEKTQIIDDKYNTHWWFILELSNDDIERFNQIKIFNNGSEIVNDKKENGYKKLDRVKGLQFNFLEFEGHAQNISFNMTFKHIFLTKDELDTELSKIDVKWNPWVEHPFLENLSDSYFEEKVIIAYFYWTSGSNIIRNVDSIYIADDKLIINVINGYESNAVNNDIFLYPILIEVNREDIGCVNDLKINIFGRTVYNYYDFE